MSDPVAEAAAALAQQGAAPSSTEPVQAPEVAQAGELATAAAAAAPSADSSSTQASLPPSESTSEVPNDAATLPAGAATPAVTGNVLLNAAPVVDAPVIDAPAAVEPVAEVAEPLPRESHLMLLEHKLAAMRAKLVNAERVTLDEFEQILGHIRAVL